MMATQWFLVLTATSMCISSLAAPNFIIFLTDDQDLSLGGLIPMKKVYSLVAEKGATFSNMFVTTPLCCPSRASILTGKYAHHHSVVNNSVSGNCNSNHWQTQEEPNTFVTYLKKAGYTTFHAGKYLNQYGKPSTGGTRHIPLGWDHWFTLVGNSRYYNYSLSVNGKHVYYGSDYKKDYLTDVIVRESIKFLHKQNNSQPFFMFLSFPAPHSPFTPAPQYEKNFSNVSAPRIPNFNIPGGKYKHWLLRQPPSPLPKPVIDEIDEIYRKRWQTLLSVDDGIESIIKVLKRKGILKQTYVFFTSDNGFHFGQFSLPSDKRQPYDFDIRVPLLVRGPRIKPGSIHQAPVLNIDLAPTVLELAGLSVPPQWDGKSFASVLITDVAERIHRSSFIVEHEGESSDAPIPGCPKYRPYEVHTCDIDCICEDSWNNTYTCVRELSHFENSLACFFKYEHFLEVYNLTEDPFQLHNLLSSGSCGFTSFRKLLSML